MRLELHVAEMTPPCVMGRIDTALPAQAFDRMYRFDTASVARSTVMEASPATPSSPVQNRWRRSETSWWILTARGLSEKSQALRRDSGLVCIDERGEVQ